MAGSGGPWQIRMDHFHDVNVTAYTAPAFSKTNPGMAHIIESYSMSPKPGVNLKTDPANDKNVVVDDKDCLATNARYMNTLNPRGIIATWNYGPGRAQPTLGDNTDLGPMSQVEPECQTSLRRWADIAFLLSKSRFGADPEKPKQLKFVAQVGIKSIATKNTIAKVMATKTDDYEKFGPKTFKEAFWFDMASDQATALLGTENGLGAAQPVIQDKQELGWKTVRRIKVYKANQAQRNGPDLALFFKLENVPRPDQTAYLG